jgi:hypothetical protein
LRARKTKALWALVHEAQRSGKLVEALEAAETLRRVGGEPA